MLFFLIMQNFDELNFKVFFLDACKEKEEWECLINHLRVTLVILKVLIILLDCVTFLT